MIKAIKNKYYTFTPGEFLPIYIGGELANRKEFHAYKIKKILGDPRGALYVFTHYSS